MCSQHAALGDDERELGTARQRYSRADGHVLIGNYVGELRPGSDDGVLHDYAVFEHGPGLYPHAAEDDAVLDLALDEAAVGDEAVFDCCALAVVGGDVCPALGVDGPVDVYKRQL